MKSSKETRCRKRTVSTQKIVAKFTQKLQCVQPLTQAGHVDVSLSREPHTVFLLASVCSHSYSYRSPTVFPRIDILIMISPLFFYVGWNWSHWLNFCVNFNNLLRRVRHVVSLELFSSLWAKHIDVKNFNFHFQYYKQFRGKIFFLQMSTDPEV